MACVNWLRSRQEQQEIAFWLSYAYDIKDKSLSNRLYLLYLIIFFSIWWFIVLIFFAEVGASIFTRLAPANPINAALALEVFVLAFWWMINAVKAVWRSPAVFTEEDAYLICQMPLNPRNIVLRWMLMPWVKHYLPIALISATIGFSLAETILVPMEFTSEMFVNYLWYGLQILMIITPIHLALFSIIWVIGIWCLNNGRRFIYVLTALITSILISLILISLVILSLTQNVSLPLRGFIEVIKSIFLAGFGSGELIKAMFLGWIFALGSLLILIIPSIHFSPSRAAQETMFDEKVRSLTRYGLVSQVKEMKEKKRLRVREQTFWQPSWENGRALLWKDILQNLRIIRFAKIYGFILIVSTMVSFALIHDIKARLPILTIWTIQIGKITSDRVRNDLSRWTIIKQLPLSHSKRFFYDVLFTYSLGFICSLAGMIIGTVLSGSLSLTEMFLLPGMIAIGTGISVFDIVRRSRSSLLIKGQVPQVSELGHIGAVVCVGVPLLLAMIFPGIIGGLLSVLVSLLLGWVAIRIAVNAFRAIGDN